MTILLDVNVLIALVDPAHIRHEHARNWFARHAAEGWATCPITENGLVRILSHPRYPGGGGAAADLVRVLKALRAHPHHVFWPDHVSLCDDDLFDVAYPMRHDQTTDAYLLGLAVAHSGRLATYDTRLEALAVTGGAVALWRLDAEV